MIRIVKFGSDHLSKTFDWMQDESLKDAFLLDVKVDQEGHKSWFRRISKTSDERVYAILMGDDHIGNIGLKNIDMKNKKAESWIYIGADEGRGKGYGIMALKHLNTLSKNDFQKIYCHVSVVNIASLKTFLKAGYSMEGILHKEMFFKNQFIDLFRLATILSS